MEKSDTATHDKSGHATAYRNAQRAMADLKTAVYELLAAAPQGLTNSEIGRALGIYHGHVGHEGHIPRTLLSLMETEGVAVQEKASKRWRLRAIRDDHASVNT